MDTRRIADRLLARLLGTGKSVVSARRRALATNGTDQERRVLVKQPELEANVLEILARRGPDDVTMAVARHPSLQLETAHNLVRIKNPALASALESRFGDSLSPDSGNTTTSNTMAVTAVPAASDIALQTAQPELAGTDNVLTAPHESPSHPTVPHVEGLTGSSEAEPTVAASGSAAAAVPVTAESADGRPFPVPEMDAPDSSQPDTQTASQWSPEDFLPQAPMGTDPSPPDASETESEQLTDADDDLDFLSAVEQLEDDLDRLALMLGHDPLEAPGESRAKTDRYDEAAEIRFVKAFQRIPDGRAGQRLLAALSQGANAPKLHKLIELYRAGLDVDDIAVAWTVRESWNASHGDSYAISYRSMGAIVRSFNGTPDPDEVLQLLGLLRDNFHLTRPERTQFFYHYADELADSMEASARSGFYVPLDILAVASNYR